MRKTVKGFTDKGETEQYAARLENEARLRSTGMIDESQEKLAAYRITPLEEHLTAFEKSLADTTGKHAKLTMSRIRRVVKGCEIEKLADLELGGFPK